jgi:hypothetical protein
MSTILLLSHDPQIPSLGPLRVTKLEEADVSLSSRKPNCSQAEKSQSRIKEQVRVICGIAISDGVFFTTKLVAGFAIAMCTCSALSNSCTIASPASRHLFLILGQSADFFMTRRRAIHRPQRTRGIYRDSKGY